jgi:hypothetical protein
LGKTQVPHVIKLEPEMSIYRVIQPLTSQAGFVRMS